MFSKGEGWREELTDRTQNESKSGTVGDNFSYFRLAYILALFVG